MNRLTALFVLWRRRIQARRTLAQMDVRCLRDAGIDPGLADFEAAQPFWRPPVRLCEHSTKAAIAAPSDAAPAPLFIGAIAPTRS